MMPLEDSIKDMKLYYKIKLKWYEKLWYFFNWKERRYQELGPIKSLEMMNSDRVYRFKM